MEVVVVLQCVVVIEVLALIHAGHGLLVVVRVDDGLVVGIVLLRVAVDGELAQALEPLRSQLVAREESQGSGEDVGLPAILLGLGVAGIASGNRALQLVVALSLQELVDVVLLLVGELVPLEKGRVGY